MLANVVEYAIKAKIRVDPMVYELNAYFKEIEKFYTTVPNNRYLPVESKFDSNNSNYSNVTMPSTAVTPGPAEILVWARLKLSFRAG